MYQPKRLGALLFILALLSGCARPTQKPGILSKVKAEAALLASTYPARRPRERVIIPKAQWPPAIASLQPRDVTVYKSDVSILIKAGFDGGWGYYIPLNGQTPMPAECYSEPSPGVFWHAPC